MTSTLRTSRTARDSITLNGLYEGAPSAPRPSAALEIVAALFLSMPWRTIVFWKTGWRSRTTTRSESGLNSWTVETRTSCTTFETFPTCTSWRRRRRYRPAVSWCRSSRSMVPTVGGVHCRSNISPCRTWDEPVDPDLKQAKPVSKPVDPPPSSK